MLRKTLALTVLALAVLVPAAPAGPKAQETIPLPPEFRPEGIASGAKDSFYVGSIPRGSVFKGSYRTGEGIEFVPPHPGRNHLGLKVDRRFDRLFVAGGPSKGVYVYDANTGEDVAAFPLPDAGFINDVVVTKRAAYFTDSQVAQLYRVGIARDGTLSEPERIPLTGELQYQPGFNANGIEAIRGGRALIVVQTNLGKLFKVRARTGVTREIDLDQPVPNGDGLLLHRGDLFVVQNQLNQIARVHLRKRARRGEVEEFITHPAFDVPTTIAPFKKFIYAVNARFDRPDNSDDDIVRVDP